MALEEGVVAAFHDEPRDLGREEAAQAAEPLELVHLGGNLVLQLQVPVRQLGRLLLDRVVVALDPDQGADSRQQLRLVEGLLMKSSAPASIARSLLLIAARGDHDHGKEAGAVRRTDAAAGLVAVDARHQDVEQHEIGHRTGRAQASAASPSRPCAPRSRGASGWPPSA